MYKIGLYRNYGDWAPNLNGPGTGGVPAGVSPTIAPPPPPNTEDHAAVQHAGPRTPQQGWVAQDQGDDEPLRAKNPPACRPRLSGSDRGPARSPRRCAAAVSRPPPCASARGPTPARLDPQGQQRTQRVYQHSKLLTAPPSRSASPPLQGGVPSAAALTPDRTPHGGMISDTARRSLVPPRPRPGENTSFVDERIGERR